MNTQIQNAVGALKNAGIVVYPTDTAYYGLGVDVTNEEAIRKLFKLKGRNAYKAVHITVADMVMAERYAEVTDDAKKLAEAFLPGPLTLVLKKKNTVPDRLVGGKNTVGIRIPDNEIACSIVQMFGKPITATSANASGDETPYSVEAVMRSFGENADDIDAYIDGGTLPQISPSTLVDLTQREPVILREGPITRDEIMNVIR